MRESLAKGRENERNTSKESKGETWAEDIHSIPDRLRPVRGGTSSSSAGDPSGAEARSTLPSDHFTGPDPLAVRNWTSVAIVQGQGSTLSATANRNSDVHEVD